MSPENIIRIRVNESGLKLVYLAEKAEMSKDHLSKSLKGKRKLRPREFIALCSILGLDIGDFAGTG